jgi:carboxylate-amine ligase
VQGLHVHVGMPDAETCLRVMEHFVPWLPVILALSANSPWFEGERTGLLSTRAEILGLLPRHGAPPRFESWADWERLVRRFVDAGLAPGYGAIHWDIRPHPRFGTLEVRMPDQPTDVARTGAFVTLVHAVAAWALEQPPALASTGDRAVFMQNRWAASRFGPRAELIHPEREGAKASAVDLYGELVARIDADPLGGGSCEADLQLVDDPHEATADVVRRSLAFQA